MDYTDALDLAIKSFHINGQVERNLDDPDPSAQRYSIPAPKAVPTTQEIIDRADKFFRGPEPYTPREIQPQPPRKVSSTRLRLWLYSQYFSDVEDTDQLTITHSDPDSVSANWTFTLPLSHLRLIVDFLEACKGDL